MVILATADAFNQLSTASQDGMSFGWQCGNLELLLILIKVCFKRSLA